MSDSKAREAAARAIFVEDGPHTHPWEMQNPYRINEFRTMANAAIDAYIAALGETHAIVPRNPTVAMIRALTATWDEEGKAQVAKWSLGTFAEDYRAMLNAAEPQPTGQR